MNNKTLLVEIIAILKKYTTIPALLKKTYTNFPCVKTITYLQLETTLNAIQIKSSVENKQLVHLFYITIKPLIIQTILDELNNLKNKYKQYDNIENDILLLIEGDYSLCCFYRLSSIILITATRVPIYKARLMSSRTTLLAFFYYLFYLCKTSQKSFLFS